MLGFLENASEDIISLSGAFSLHDKVFSLRSRKGSGTSQYEYVSERGLPIAVEWEFLESPAIPN